MLNLVLIIFYKKNPAKSRRLILLEVCGVWGVSLVTLSCLFQ